MQCALKIEHIGYRRREPEQDLLHRVLREHLETFLARAQTEESSLPRHVKQELREYLTCGILAYGFARVRCNECGKSMAVGFSCKRTHRDQDAVRQSLRNDPAAKGPRPPQTGPRVGERLHDIHLEAIRTLARSSSLASNQVATRPVRPDDRGRKPVMPGHAHASVS